MGTAWEVPLQPSGWHVTKRVRNPWGQVPITGGGRSLPGGTKDYWDRLLATTNKPDTVTTRHHYVPRNYLRHWAPEGDNKRIWTRDTVAGATRLLGIGDVCVSQNFYRVKGPDGPHNRVENLFGVVDAELARVHRRFRQLTDPEELEFEDLVALAATMTLQRVRTTQERRLHTQFNRWLSAQDSEHFPTIEDTTDDPWRTSTYHTRLQFEALWEAADVLTTRQIEIWDDPAGRFLTCDAPVLVPFKSGNRQSLYDASHIVWPLTPHRTIALARESVGEKAVIRTENKLAGIVRSMIEQTRERMVFGSPEQRGALARIKPFHTRPQMSLTCSQRTPRGEYIEPPGCCTKNSVALATRPIIAVCRDGLHEPAPDFTDLT